MSCAADIGPGFPSLAAMSDSEARALQSLQRLAARPVESLASVAEGGQAEVEMKAEPEEPPGEARVDQVGAWAGAGFEESLDVCVALQKMKGVADT